MSRAESQKTIRTKGLTILARILAASLVRDNPEYCKSSDVSKSSVDPSNSGTEADDGVGDEQ